MQTRNCFAVAVAIVNAAGFVLFCFLVFCICLLAVVAAVADAATTTDVVFINFY